MTCHVETAWFIKGRFGENMQNQKRGFLRPEEEKGRIFKRAVLNIVLDNFAAIFLLLELS